MTDLIAVLSTGKGTWGHVGRLIQDGDFENIFLITNDFGKEKFTPEKESTFIVVDSRGNSLEDLQNTIKSELDGKIKGTEVALNMISGTGKEHMAVLAALLKMGLGIRQVSVTEEGVKEL